MHKVLIISDTPSVAFSSLMALDDLFDELQVCNSLAAAAELLSSFKPDVVIAYALTSPRCSPQVVARQAKVGDIPVILLSSGLSSVETSDPLHSVRIEPPLTPIRARRALDILSVPYKTISDSHTHQKRGCAR